MLNNYITTAIRAIKKDTQHFLLNLIGFSIGLTAAILMALYAQNELSYDKQHPDSEHIYRAHQDFTAWGLQITGTSLNSSATEIEKNADILDAFSLITAKDLPNYREDAIDLVQNDNTRYRLKNFYMATDNILDFIALEVIRGDIKNTLHAPNKLALSEKEALRLFGSIEVIGNALSYKSGQYTVGAVFKNLPENTHFKFDSLTQVPADFLARSWGYNYFKLRQHADIQKISQAMTEQLHLRRKSKRWQQIKIDLVNLEQLHFNSNGPFEMKKGGSFATLQICISLSVILILIASINFINLSIAQSAKRAKEVGVRKALGASKGQLITQFLTESLFVVSLAGILAFALIEIGLPSFNQVMDRDLSLNYGSQFMLVTIAVIFTVGLLSGLYPALFISSFSAKRVLSGDLVRGGTAIFIRKLTLCLQGALSVGLIIAAIILYQQMTLVNNLDVGYEKHGRIIVKGLPTDVVFKRDNNTLLEAMTRLEGVKQVTLTGTDLTNDMDGEYHFTWPNGERLTGAQPSVATGFYAAEVLGLKLLAGRDFLPKFNSEWYQVDEEGNRRLGVLVSRKMVQLAGYSDLNSVVGMELSIARSKLTASVVGVIENVKIGSARQQSLPISFALGRDTNVLSNIVIKTSTPDVNTLITQINALVEQELRLSDITISLVKDDYKAVHKNENKALDMVTLFSLLAIFLTSLGTFGLASFAAIRRQKEIAIRKVLGASRFSLVNLLAKEFLLLILMSIAIAFPVSYWLLGDWLANFSDRVNQTVWVYLFAALCIAVITWVTVASLAFKAASTRPSLILRYE
ncbi:ABC transporter permease [Pseudoalteromonas denitrificans]|uniref:Putative ABC transport system permease protein n=1 Tax=Pseudoalteromonas denitrificans DSM 6059 TaxID=1123010 RepID=A0A1I1JH48_9GAMM|nr:ABC transporter permease [Pseudoalteromonas denitrificans]SFC47949.1 putative ABC transport system permease protein [Pseudoalteromonas denitrificans DSM 6059]